RTRGPWRRDSSVAGRSRAGRWFRSYGGALERDARIEPGVQQVDEERAEHERDRRDEHDSLDDRIVLRRDRLHRQAPDPRPREDRLSDERALDDRAHLDADEG